MITMLSYAQIIALLVVCFVYYFHRRRSCQNPILFDWPFFGMLPSLIPHLWNLHEHITDALKQQACTTNFRGPWFTKLNYLVTCDPMNVQHILSKNFDSYVKGPEYRDHVDILGDGVVSSDSETWKYSRTLLHPLLKDKSFEKLCEKVVHKKIQSGFFRVLDDVINVPRKEQGIVDLQDIFKRFNFDYFCCILLGHDPHSLSIEFPESVIGKALAEWEEIAFFRYTKPKSLWKLQRWLQIGAEKKLAAALRAFDQFLYQHIASKRDDRERKTREIKNESNEELETQTDFLTTLMRERELGDRKAHIDEKFLRDTISSLFVAGRETLTSALTWFFWHVATNPLVEAKIIEEIKEKIVAKGKNPSFLGGEDVKNLVYLHGAICESLRLFPPIFIDSRQAIKSDVLPSGHVVDPKSMILLSYYSMGRLEKSWGKDYLEFKPERWISDTGDIVSVPLHKFVTFGTGPRICLGRNMAFVTSKMVASAILWNYHVQVVKDHPISPTVSLVTMMEHGLKVKLAKRR